MAFSRKNFTCPECGAKLNTDSNRDICHICGADVSEIVDNIFIGQAEDGPCGDAADDVNSPFYRGCIDDLYDVDNGGDADDYYEDYGEDDYDEYEDEEFEPEDFEEIYEDDDAVLDNDYYDDFEIE